jgi:hypothetical protein
MPLMIKVKMTYGGDKRIEWEMKKPADYYMMDHTTHMFLIGADGHYKTSFPQALL